MDCDNQTKSPPQLLKEVLCLWILESVCPDQTASSARSALSTSSSVL